jgi:hypothetical protein
MNVASETEPEELRVHVRNAREADRNYLLSTWRASWMLSLDNTRARPRYLKRQFAELVTDGLLTEPDTRIIVACCPERTEIILGWAVFTPSLVPTIHYVYVRDKRNDIPLRRRGILGILVSFMGVRDGADIVYTSRPKERARFEDRGRGPLIEAGLLEAAARRGIAATHVPLQQWLGATGKEIQ